MAGDKTSAFKTLIAPALFSLLLFLTITYVLLPAYRRYRARYAQYLPLDTLQSHTTSLRGRLPSPITLLARWRSWRASRSGRVDGVDPRQSRDIDEEDGEELGDVDEDLWQVMQGRVRGAPTVDHTRRLSRELEEGFRDESDDEDDSRRH